MLSMAEYQVALQDINELGQNTDQQIADQTQDATPQQAINTSKSLVSQYQQQLKQVLDRAMYDTAGNAFHHYAMQTKTTLPPGIIDDIVKAQYNNKYYGMTLNQRLVLLKLRLNRVITQTAAVGVPNLSGLFTQPFPFGAQTNISKRLLQGTAIKVEQDMARKAADVTGYPLIRWTLSDHHRETCQCEDYAIAVDKDVVAYIKDNNLDIDAKGLYFSNELPNPPHPNCQCEFNLVGDNEIVPSESRRPLSRLRRLVRKLLRS